MSSAESMAAGSQLGEALDKFEDAAKADPTRKEPWVRSAQIHFDTGNYGRAIVAAQEVLQRDPADTVAESVLTVSGFRVAVQSLQRLQASGALSSDAAKHEARQLVSAMRNTMGAEIVADPAAATPAPRRRAATRRAAPRPAQTQTPAAPRPAQRPASATNPFEKLGGN